MATVNCFNYTFVSTVQPANQKIFGWGPPVRDRVLAATAVVLTGGGHNPGFVFEYARTILDESSGNYNYYLYALNDGTKPITSFSATLAVINA